MTDQSCIKIRDLISIDKRIYIEEFKSHFTKVYFSFYLTPVILSKCYHERQGVKHKCSFDIVSRVLMNHGLYSTYMISLLYLNMTSNPYILSDVQKMNIADEIEFYRSLDVKYKNNVANNLYTSIQHVI